MKFRFAVLLIAVLMFVMLIMTACGENTDSTKDEAVPASTAVSETTVVLETTADGGTVEQDSEGNKITKDKDGTITSVKDKNGNTVSVTEYITTHSWIVGSDSDTGGGTSSSSGSTSSSGSSSSQQSSSKTSSESSSKSSVEDEIVEDEIPIVIATVPDEDELPVIPDP